MGRRRWNFLFVCICCVGFLVYELVFNRCMIFVLNKIHVIYILHTLYYCNCESCILCTNCTVRLKLMHIYFIGIYIVLMNWIIMYILSVEYTERSWKCCHHCMYYIYSLKNCYTKTEINCRLVILFHFSFLIWKGKMVIFQLVWGVHVV